MHRGVAMRWSFGRVAKNRTLVRSEPNHVDDHRKALVLHRIGYQYYTYISQCFVLRDKKKPLPGICKGSIESQFLGQNKAQPRNVETGPSFTIANNRLCTSASPPRKSVAYSKLRTLAVTRLNGQMPLPLHIEQNGVSGQLQQGRMH